MIERLKAKDNMALPVTFVLNDLLNCDSWQSNLLPARTTFLVTSMSIYAIGFDRPTREKIALYLSNKFKYTS